MARVSQWRRTISDAVSWRQDQGLAATIYIVREVGPTGFLLKEEGESKPVKVILIFILFNSSVCTATLLAVSVVLG